MGYHNDFYYSPVSLPAGALTTVFDRIEDELFVGIPHRVTVKRRERFDDGTTHVSVAEDQLLLFDPVCRLGGDSRYELDYTVFFDRTDDAVLLGVQLENWKGALWVMVSAAKLDWLRRFVQSFESELGLHRLELELDVPSRADAHGEARGTKPERGGAVVASPHEIETTKARLVGKWAAIGTAGAAAIGGLFKLLEVLLTKGRP